MVNPMHPSRLACFAAIVFFVPFLPGCGSANLDGYRPAREHSAKTTAVADSQPQQNSLADSERPRPTENVPDSATPKFDIAANDSDLLPASALVPVNMIDGGNVRALMSIPASEPGIGPRSGIPAVAGDPSEAEPRKIELLVKEKVFRTEPKTGAVRLSFDDLDLLKILNMEPVVDNAVELMPDWLRAINGRAVRLRGFMYPTYEAEGIERFVLARDNQICCFGRDPKIYDLVQVDMKEGKSTNYIPPTRAFDVVGKLKIEMQSQDGKPYGLYSIEQAEVIDR